MEGMLKEMKVVVSRLNSEFMEGLPDLLNVPMFPDLSPAQQTQLSTDKALLGTPLVRKWFSKLETDREIAKNTAGQTDPEVRTPIPTRIDLEMWIKTMQNPVCQFLEQFSHMGEQTPTPPNTPVVLDDSDKEDEYVMQVH